MITFSELGRWGRLGNQMYEYVALLGIADELGFEVAIPPLDRHLLAGCFDITAPILTARDARRIKHVFHEPRLGWSERYRQIEDLTDLRGYFQSPRYFPPRDMVLRELAFRRDVRRAGDEIEAELRRRGRPLVALTVRRGDYATKPEQFVNLWSTAFYDRAIEAVADLGPLLVVSSDDPDWCRTRFAPDRLPAGVAAAFIDGVSDQAQLRVLSRCDHSIVANSSYAWWAAWLNESDGRRLAPAQWWGLDAEFPDRDRDPLPDGWTSIAIND